LRIEFKIFLAAFSLAFVALFIVHLAWLPFYWEYASSQQGRPIDLYSPNAWIPGIVLYSSVVAIFTILSYELYSSLRKGKANEATIFITTFFLVDISLWLFSTLWSLRWGHTMHLPSQWSYSKSTYGVTLGMFFFGSVGAVFSVILFEVYKLARCARKRRK